MLNVSAVNYELFFDSAFGTGCSSFRSLNIKFGDPI